ncbi:DUF2306 domain-containing protein [Christiangramia sabulilitoris]|uniref:DUF2306 domain-containing protein n=1 Tax=Christiangramia sabulilitoris TaxID=2583991 RepID=UPI001FB6C359|nr:DUF2306 domain-containing protein [Christiangramia sabulilitoris]
MNKVIHKSKWFVFGILSSLIGLYPIIYFLIDRHFGLLSSKSEVLLNDQLWNINFYGHITLGGIALLVGWTQFSPKLRKRNIKLHRNIGRIYIVTALISSICGIYIAQFATGGISNIIGFTLSGVVWLLTTVLAYNSVIKGNIQLHQKFMIYSYAVCFSAVTLRICLPLLTSVAGNFSTAYLIVGWLSWVPNLFVAYYLINRNKQKLVKSI